jgi:hypothetical protein
LNSVVKIYTFYHILETFLAGDNSVPANLRNLLTNEGISVDDFIAPTVPPVDTRRPENPEDFDQEIYDAEQARLHNERNRLLELTRNYKDIQNRLLTVLIEEVQHDTNSLQNLNIFTEKASFV